MHYDQWGEGGREKFLNRILTHLYCTKHNEINIGHSDVQKRISYKKYYILAYIFYIQVQTNVFRCIPTYKEKCFKAYFDMFLFDKI